MRVRACSPPWSFENCTPIPCCRPGVSAGVIQTTDTRRTAQLIQQTVMYGWLMNRLVKSGRARVTAEEAWEFCLHGLGG